MNDDKDGVNLLTMLMVQWEYQGEIVELHWNIQAIFFPERDHSELSNYVESRPSSIGLTVLRRTGRYFGEQSRLTDTFLSVISIQFAYSYFLQFVI